MAGLVVMLGAAAEGLGEADGAELLGEDGLMLGPEGGQEVDVLGGGFLDGGRDAVEGEVAGPLELDDGGAGEQLAGLPDVDLGEVEGVEAELDLLWPARRGSTP